MKTVDRALCPGALEHSLDGELEAIARQPLELAAVDEPVKRAALQAHPDLTAAPTAPVIGRSPFDAARVPAEARPCRRGGRLSMHGP